MIAETANSDLRDAAEAALRQLVSVKPDGDAVFVSLPLYYPSGSSVCLRISQRDHEYRVTDWAMAHREIELVGGDALFNRTAKRAAERTGALIAGEEVYSVCSLGELAPVIADIGWASHYIAHAIVDRAQRQSESDILISLTARLKHLFGENRVESEKLIAGFSTNDWNVSALVHIDGREAVFDVVSNHHASVFTTSTKFNDLKLLDNAPKTIAVVKDKAAMGAYYNILAQAGYVIQDDAPDMSFLSAASVA